MNALKNIEIAFIAAAVIAIGASFVTAHANTLAVSANSALIVKADYAPMPVVTVSARRLSAAEKAALI